MKRAGLLQSEVMPAATLVMIGLPLAGPALAGTPPYSITELGTLCASDCCYMSFEEGCSDATCEQQICASDPSCCTEWDKGCAAAARASCAVCVPSTECDTNFFTYNSAVAINESGTIVGYSRANGIHHFFGGWVWSEGVITPLPYLPGDNGSIPADINEAGQIAGSSIADGFLGTHRAVRWQDSPGWTVSQVFIVDSQGKGIDDRGVVAGHTASDFCPDSSHRGWRLPGGYLQSVVTGAESEALGINAVGDAVGRAQIFADTCKDWWFAVHWPASGGIIELDFIGTNGSSAHDLNLSGVIVGEAGFGFSRRAVAWAEEPGRGLDSGLNDLGTLGGEFSEAYAVNDSGWIVGTAQNPSDMFRAFVWIEGVMYDLNEFLPKDSGWVLTSANDINNDQQIVGHGQFNGQTRAFLMSPAQGIPAVSGFSMLAMAAGLIAAGAWIRMRSMARPANARLTAPRR